MSTDPTTMTLSDLPAWPVPPTESERLKELVSLAIVDTPEEGLYDGIVEVAAALFDVPYAAVTLVGAERQWFKARVGVPFPEMGREIAFCSHTILSSATMVVEDMTQDARFQGHPLVTGALGLRFYAGAPLVTSRGECVGTVCVLDTRPRTMDSRQRRLLERLSGQAVGLMEMERTMAAMAAVLERPFP